jgi:hypothetical protein
MLRAGDRHDFHPTTTRAEGRPGEIVPVPVVTKPLPPANHVRFPNEPKPAPQTPPKRPNAPHPHPAPLFIC